MRLNVADSLLRYRTDANNQINDVLSKLTALGTVLIPVRSKALAFVPDRPADTYTHFNR